MAWDSSLRAGELKVGHATSTLIEPSRPSKPSTRARIGQIQQCYEVGAAACFNPNNKGERWWRQQLTKQGDWVCALKPFDVRNTEVDKKQLDDLNAK